MGAAALIFESKEKIENIIKEANSDEYCVEEDENLAPEKDGSDHYSFQHGVKEFPSPALFPTNPMVQSHRPEKGLSVFGSGATKPLF
mmetsp:Transcript_10556/g.30916  ORF Transcript_10556/g.30916 Transcript_10556/m.30916 type:complete len:87 (-) Transcript_10556:120-380(-)